jgi:hypothetical protein
MEKPCLIGLTLFALCAILMGNTVFGQTPVPPDSTTTGTCETSSCIMYDGTNLKIVDITYSFSPGECQKELDTIIGTFHPTGITVSTQDVVLYQGGTHYREDIFYLTK